MFHIEERVKIGRENLLYKQSCCFLGIRLICKAIKNIGTDKLS